MDIIKAREQLLNLLLGTVFFVTALIQIIKMVRHKGLAESAGEKAAELEQAEEKVAEDFNLD